MPEFTQLVRDRLRAQKPPAGHLDPDLLAAFAEHRLTGRERTIALAHLAACSECREVVALSAQIEPEPQAAAAATASGAVSRGFFSPRLWRFALAGALGALAVSATVLLRIDKERQPVTTAKATVAEPGFAVTATGSSDAQSQKTQTSKTGAATNIPRGANKARTKSIPPVKEQETLEAPNRIAIANGSIGALQRDSTGVIGGRTVSAAPDQASSADVVQNQATQKQTVQIQAAGKPVEQMRPFVAQAPPPPPPQPASSDSALRQPSQIAELPPATAPAKTLPAQTRAARTTVSGMAGTGQPNANAAPAPSPQMQVASAYEGPILQKNAAKLMRFDAGAATWNITADGKLQRASATGPEGPLWQQVAVDDHTVFRVVNASGADIWAGGNNGALFHSTDSGAHWTRTVAEDSGQKLAGDVISIKVAGTNHEIVRLRTSAGQNWLSNDGGKTWKIEAR